MGPDKQQSQLKAKNQSIGILLVIISTVSISTEAVVAKIAYSEGVNVISALSLRYIVAACIFSAGLLLWKQSIKLNKRDVINIIMLTLGTQAVTVLLLFNAFRYVPAAIAILFLYLYPAMVTFLAFVFLQEPLTRRKIYALFLTLGGCIVIIGQPLHGLDLRGVGFAVGAAITNAIFLVGVTRLISHIPVPVYNTCMSVVLAVFFTLTGAIQGELVLSLTPKAWGAILVLGIVCTVIAMAALLQGVKRIGASRTAIISTFEPVSTSILGFWLLRETITNWQIAGGMLVLLGVIMQRRE